MFLRLDCGSGQLTRSICFNINNAANNVRLFSSKTVKNIVLNYEMRTRVIRYEEDLPEY